MIHRTPWLVVFSLLVVCSLSRSAEPVEPQKLDLFAAGDGGYGLYRIPGIVVTSQGTVLAYCEARKNGKTDWGHIDVVLRRSTDGGKTWSPMKKIVELDGKFVRNPAAVAQSLGKDGEITLNNPVAIADPRPGVVHFLYCVEYNRVFYMRSKDDGLTFGKPVEITAAIEKLRSTYDWQCVAVGPGHGLRLQNGRLIAAVWMSTGKGGHAHRPSVVSTIYSDNDGETWQLGDIVANETKPLINPSESVLLELADGKVLINMRSESPEHRRAIAISPDGSTKWSEPKFDVALLEPICMANIIRWPSPKGGGQDSIVFSNPHNLDRTGAKPGQGRDRKNLSLQLSHDDAKTWPINKTLEAGASGYSDLAVAADGSLLCFYERTLPVGEKNERRSYLTLARINREWLEK